MGRDRIRCSNYHKLHIFPAFLLAAHFKTLHQLQTLTRKAKNARDDFSLALYYTCSPPVPTSIHGSRSPNFFAWHNVATLLESLSSTELNGFHDPYDVLLCYSFLLEYIYSTVITSYIPQRMHGERRFDELEKLGISI